jgi:hypothetical protein
MTAPHHLSTGPEETAKLLQLATYASISVALMLIVAKLIAWGLSDSGELTGNINRLGYWMRWHH